MQIEDKKIEQIIKKLESALNSIGSMNMWLPGAIDDAINHAINGNPIGVDRVSIDKMLAQREKDEKNQIEINSLYDQLEESKKQTREIAKQTKYLFLAFVITFISLIFNIFIQIKPNWVGLEKQKELPLSSTETILKAQH